DPYHPFPQEVPFVGLGRVASSRFLRPKPGRGKPLARGRADQYVEPRTTDQLAEPAHGEGLNVLAQDTVIRHAGVVEAVGPDGHLLEIDRSKHLEAGADEPLGRPARSAEQVNCRRAVQGHDTGGFTLPVIPTKRPQLTMVAQRLRRPTE